MNVLFHLGHPAHFHLFKNTIENLKNDGHNCTIAIKSKDVLEELLKNSGYDYINILPGGRKSGKLKSIFGQLLQDFNLFKFCIKNRQDILIGTSVAITHVGKVLGIPSFLVGEDDAAVVPKASKAALPYATLAISPTTCSKGKWEYKKISYKGYQELAYLHPNHFTADKKVVEKYFSVDEPYFIIRFAKLTAHHDAGIKGINTEIANNIIDILKPHGKIYITSERELEPQFEPYRIKINPLDMHHVMAFAHIYIGDSQTMAAEAGVLGVPFIRFNDFVGRIGYLRELEDDYQLGYGIKTNEVEKLYKTLKDLLNMPDREEVFSGRRNKMLSEKIDYAKFLTWFIQSYPYSSKTMKDNPDYQNRFK
jgi:predicted glycosyltransferase